MTANYCTGALVITIVDVMRMEVDEPPPPEIPSRVQLVLY